MVLYDFWILLRSSQLKAARNDGNTRRYCQSPSLFKEKKRNDDSIPQIVISTVTHGVPAECVQWRNLYRLDMNVEIPPLRILRWRSACFGRNDGGRVRHCEEERRSNPEKTSHKVYKSQFNA